jgi:hypothetical protein
MAARLDSVQMALPRAVTDAQQQQHAAQRQPVVAQEQVTAQTREEMRLRETRPEALEPGEGPLVRGELVDGAEERQGRRDRQERQGRRRQTPSGQLPTAAATVEQPDTGSRTPPARKTAEIPLDGKGGRVDLRL